MFGRTNIQSSNPISYTQPRKERKMRRLMEKRGHLNLINSGILPIEYQSNAASTNFGMKTKPSGLIGRLTPGFAQNPSQVVTPHSEASRPPLDKSCEKKLSFPNLILYYGHAKFNRNYDFLKLSFDQTGYPLQCDVNQSQSSIHIKLTSSTVLISEGFGFKQRDALQQTVFNAMKRLQPTNYAIEVKRSYISECGFPKFLLNVDPLMSHIYKVVCLKGEGWPEFPYPLSGAVDYVYRADELWEYIENHCKSSSTADLHILNIEKNQRQLVKMISRKYKREYKHIFNCSNRGSLILAPITIPKVFGELKMCGGENVKHILIPPGSETIGEENSSGGQIQQENSSGGQIQQEWVTNETEDIKIDPWICDNLIIVEYVHESGNVHTPKELIFQAVKQCPNLEEFIIMKKVDKYSGKISAEAMIDRKVVGRASGMDIKEVKKAAAEHALHNLKKNCRYIQGKTNYFGYGTTLPIFLTRAHPVSYNTILETDLYRIVMPDETNIEGLLKRFRHQRIEDLYFHAKIPSDKSLLIAEFARNMNFNVRFLAHKWICVSKKKTPREILATLLKCNGFENAKYKLLTPPERVDPNPDEGNARHHFENLFDITSERKIDYNNMCDSRRDDFQGSSQHQKTRNTSQLFDVEHKFKPNQEPIYSPRGADSFGRYEENRGNTRNTSGSNFGHTVNITDCIWSELPIDKYSHHLDTGEHNFLKKEHIIINRNLNNSFPSENSEHCVENINKSDFGKQAHETRKVSSFDYGDNVWFEDDYNMNSRTSQQPENPSRSTQHQDTSTNRQDYTGFRHEGREEDYKHAKSLKRYASEQKPIIRGNHESIGSLSAYYDKNNADSQHSFGWNRKSEIYPLNNPRSEEPPNKLAKGFDTDAQFKQPIAPRYNSFNKQSFDQTPRSQGKTGSDYCGINEVKEGRYYSGFNEDDKNYNPVGSSQNSSFEPDNFRKLRQEPFDQSPGSLKQTDRFKHYSGMTVDEENDAQMRSSLRGSSETESFLSGIPKEVKNYNHGLRDYASNQGICRQIEEKNKYQSSMLNRKERLEEPANKLGKPFDTDTDPRYKVPMAPSYSSFNKTSFDQSTSRVKDYKDNYNQIRSSQHGSFEPEHFKDNDYASKGGVNRQLDGKNTNDQQLRMRNRTIEMYPPNYQQSEEPLNRVMDLFETDSQYKQHMAPSHNKQYLDSSLDAKHDIDNLKARNKLSESRSSYFDRIDKLTETPQSHRFESRPFTRNIDDASRSNYESRNEAHYKSGKADPIDDRCDFNEKNKIIFDYQGRSSKEYNYVSRVDHSEETKNIIDWQHSPVASKSGFSQNSTSWNRSEERLSFTSKESETQVTKLFDMPEKYRTSIEPSNRFDRAYNNSTDISTSNSSRWTGMENPIGNRSTHRDRQKEETGQLWNKNVKQLFDQRRYY